MKGSTGISTGEWESGQAGMGRLSRQRGNAEVSRESSRFPGTGDRAQLRREPKGWSGLWECRGP